MAQNLTIIQSLAKGSFIQFILGLTICFGAYAQPGPFYNEKGIAIKGYDPVAYFTEQKAVQGSGEYQTEWDGVTWHFTNEENLQAFRKEPAKYAPQYGGWCAYGMSQNHKSPTDPMAWTIIDDKLYLNYSGKVKEKWIGDTPKYIDQADKNWVELKDK